PPRAPLHRNLPFPQDLVVFSNAPQEVLPRWQSQRHAAVTALIVGQPLIHRNARTALGRRNSLHELSASNVDRYPNPLRAEPQRHGGSHPTLVKDNPVDTAFQRPRVIRSEGEWPLNQAQDPRGNSWCLVERHFLPEAFLRQKLCLL